MEVTRYLFGIERQYRGSLHVHGTVWMVDIQIDTYIYYDLEFTMIRYTGLEYIEISDLSFDMSPHEWVSHLVSLPHDTGEESDIVRSGSEWDQLESMLAHQSFLEPN